MNTNYTTDHNDPRIIATIQNLTRRGINLPVPLPPRLELIGLLQREIKKIQFTIERMAADAPDYKQNLAGHLQTIQLINSMLAPQPPAQPPQPPASDKNKVDPKNPLATRPATQPEQLTARPQPGQSRPDHGQPRPTAGQNRPDSVQTDPNPANANPNQPSHGMDELQQLADHFQEHLTGKSPLDKLTETEQAAVIKLLNEYGSRQVAKLLAQPAPIGLNLRTNKSSLNDFRARWNQLEHRRLRRQQLEKAEHLFTKHHGDNFKAGIELIEARLLKSAANDETSAEELQLLVKTLASAKRLTLAERQQTHREQK